MMDLSDSNYVKALQSNLRATFDTSAGKAVMEFLETSCGWYESIFDPTDRDKILINAGRREVVATLKSLLKLTPEQVIALAQNQKGG